MARALQIVPDLAAVEALGTFDDRPISGTSIKVTNAGDGLSQALQVAPQKFQLGDRVYVVLETVVSKVEHTPVDDADDGPVERAHVLRAGAATIVDRDLVQAHLASMTRRIREAREAAVGIVPIPAADGDGDPWEDTHEDSGMYTDPDESGE